MIAHGTFACCRTVLFTRDSFSDSRRDVRGLACKRQVLKMDVAAARQGPCSRVHLQRVRAHLRVISLSLVRGLALPGVRAATYRCLPVYAWVTKAAIINYASDGSGPSQILITCYSASL